ncbi:glycosyltransferase [Pedobacter sp. BS3]|uniref:glycosyltransferase family 2 protein n=1 Tax=Pedobacter sp. BS3 TaxID=2567937 RepID=UPI0011F00186|nr:glycosyltransferase [Pedobacter sp. BS3]TZF82607.1 glycosyltransferase [Pedobacter sp. BS3]
MEVKISVVIPTYRRPGLLVNCMEALRRQTFHKNAYEVIVVSDGPDETTAEILAEYPEVKLLPTAVKKGPAAARNRGWLEAKGRLIAFTDDDCIPDSNWLQTLWQYYQDEDEIAYTGPVVVPLSSPPTDYEQNIANLETAEFVTANCACTKKALLKVGGFDERFRMAWREDSDLHFKFLEHNIPIHSTPATVVHPARKAQWGVSIREQKKGIFNALLYKKYPGLYKQRIRPRPLWNYYAMVLLFAGIIPALMFRQTWLALAFAGGWLALALIFSKKRLSATSHATNHVAEMMLTSLVIPFLSLYWQFYGACKYRVLIL